MNPLPYTLLAQQHIFIMIIYSFLVCRMLSIYYKMQLAISKQTQVACKARWARRLSNCQNFIIIVYFCLFTAMTWAWHFLYVYSHPQRALMQYQRVLFGILTSFKLIYEFCVLAIFLGLFYSFNSMT